MLLCQVQFSLVYVELHLEVKGRFDLIAIIFFTLAITNTDKPGEKHESPLISLTAEPYHISKEDKA